MRRLLAFALLLTATAPAQPLNLPLTLGERIAASDAVVIARVVRTGPRSTSDVIAELAERRVRSGSPRSVADLRVPHRKAEIVLEESLSGKLPRRRERVILFAMDGWGFTLRPLSPGGRVLLFLQKQGTPARWSIVNEPYGAASILESGELSDGTPLAEVRRAVRRALHRPTQR